MEINQGTPEWHQMRLGKVTASKVADVMAKIKTGESAARKNYRAQLVAERLSQTPTETFTNAAMAWGSEQEEHARDLYQFLTDIPVSQIAFVDHPTIRMAGCSPDGLVGLDGLVEIKAPSTATHIDYLLAGNAPAQYIPQMQFQMACTGRKWCDFFSFDPRLPDNLQYFLTRVNRDDAYIKTMETEIITFLAEVDDVVSKLMKLEQAA